jgi:hypothetical protein
VNRRLHECNLRTPAGGCCAAALRGVAPTWLR